MSEHTEGPWEVTDLGPAEGAGKVAFALVVGHSPVVAPSSCGTALIALAANVHLIAAAPAMLDALERIERGDGVCAGEIGFVEDAIRKAKGER